MGITVENLEESVAFYRDVVGLTEIPETSDLEMSGEWFDQLTENEGARFRVAHLDLSGIQLQLVEYTAAGGERLDLAHKRIGNPHLCIDMENISERHAALAAEGRFKVSPIVTIADTPIRSFYVTDPNGVLVEFIER
ncbi:VOC family protein, partial [Myxococcota bacterium]|nr:VOC family protein [Myxococcota bacterium]